MTVHDSAERGFERGAADYEAARPSYPQEVVDLLGAELALGPGRQVLDLAAGTGKLTRLLVGTGADLVAVEPVVLVEAARGRVLVFHDRCSTVLTADQAALLRWAANRGRDLPWRRTRDPWAVLVSEAMLQQTQVARVVPKYHAFLGRFPTPAVCAVAAQGEVVRAWAGLGYNRRASQLHRAAREIVDRHGGSVPDDLDDLLRLPGVGPYTARAVLAFAFERDVAVVDTNVARVLARRAGRTLQVAEAQGAADRWVPVGAGWAWNQALFDLGAGVCTARAPGCAHCPVADGCGWASGGNAGPDPAVGSAGVSGPQSRFEGSDRQGRGRLVDALRQGPVEVGDLAAAMGWAGDPDRARRVAGGLVAEGMVDERHGWFTLAV